VSRVWRTWAALVLFTFGSSLITPLIPLYQDRLGLSDTAVTLFFGCYVICLVPSMLTLGQLSDRIGRKQVLVGALVAMAVAQAILMATPPFGGLLAARAIQGLACGAYFGTCTAFLIDAAPRGRRGFASTLGAASIRLGLGLGPGIAGVIAQYSGHPLTLPFGVHLACLAVTLWVILGLPETVTARSRRPLGLRLEVPAAERAVFWRVLVPSGILLSLFDGVGLALVPVFLARDLAVDNLAVVGGAGFLVLAAGAVSPLLVPRLRPKPAIGWGLVAVALASVGIAAGAPTGSATLVLVAEAATGAAAGVVFKGGVDLCAQVAPIDDRGKLISAYYVACYLGGFSIPLLLVGLAADRVGLPAALAALTAVTAIGAAWTGLVGLRALRALPGPIAPRPRPS
jgi:MFS family permease